MKAFRFSKWGPPDRETLRHWVDWFRALGIKTATIQDPLSGETALYRVGVEQPTTPEEEDERS